ncbi:TPA: hypothetical protein ACNIH0_002991 [Acinetobacter baumannii]|uniref:hypothetical protein n=1 Tax=Acinetobacter calcoaceticus/baumannii complex TaxID=909768 RepID=UPI0004493F22|nr:MULTISPECIES: hypothetical protein [Acinetobacter calcoaceticus/baumannii complex]KCX93063.1 hypothetical protein J568_2037 [Acinetobacter baumannii 6112]AZB88798.1 hypothetical protein DKE39_010295 [Acinetobacter baumannii]EKU1551596.1 hypothetical protein [Acinetobacter baumannii]EKU2691069.1 hypothetical protein [Acinetobacter baumannii]EKU5255855.1 hypothetical protein [Acinetobacter baumannii]
MEYKQVRANQKGFYNDRLIQEGEVFSVPEEETALWFDDVEPKQPESKNPFSSMNKEALTQIAVEKGIQLSGAETKAQIIELLTAE